MKKPKFRNIVWLNLSVQEKLFELADKLGMSPNVLISEIVKFFLNDGKILNEFISNYEMKKELPVKYYVKCPVCRKRMELERIETHVRVVHGLEVEEAVEKIK